MTSRKNISLEKTSLALKELNSALSACSQILEEKQINAGQKEKAFQEQLEAERKKSSLLLQASQNAVSNINELAAKLDKVLN